MESGTLRSLIDAHHIPVRMDLSLEHIRESRQEALGRRSEKEPPLAAYADQETVIRRMHDALQSGANPFDFSPERLETSPLLAGVPDERKAGVIRDVVTALAGDIAHAIVRYIQEHEPDTETVFSGLLEAGDFEEAHRLDALLSALEDRARRELGW